jgi:hypothetical protein
MLSDQKAVGDKFLTTDERNDINEGVAHHAEVRILPPPTGLGSVDTYLIHKTMAARVTTAR